MGNKKSNTKTISDVLSSNPLSISLIGMSPIMLMTTSLIKALVAGLATAFVIFATKSISAVTVNFFSGRQQFFNSIISVAFFATLVDLFIQTNAYAFFRESTFLIIIIAANSILIQVLVAIDNNEQSKCNINSSISTSIYFIFLLCFQGFIRELLGQGTIFTDFGLVFDQAGQDWTISLINQAKTIPIFQMPPGGFFTYALVLIITNSIRSKLNTP